MLHLLKISKNIKIISLLLFLMSILSACQKLDIENGDFLVRGKSKESNEESLKKAKDLIYNHLSEYVSEKTERTDINIIYHSLANSDILKFEDYKIKNSKIFNNYKTSIKINDDTIQTKLDDFIISFQREGKIESLDFMRGFASIDLPDNLSLYTKSILLRDAFNRAKNNIKKELSKENIDIQKINDIIKEAYIVEETYSKKLYTVVVEVTL